MRVDTSVSSQTTAPANIFIPQAHQWVQLRERLSEFSDDQALLLCEEPNGCWVAWVPNYGEAVLRREQVLRLPDL